MATAHRGRRIAVLVLVIVVAGAAFGYWWVFVRKDQAPVDVADIEKNFASGGGDRTAKSGEPAPGVYRYTTTGKESVTALGGQTNDYPAVTTLTITNTTCGIDAQWDIATGRYDRDARCRAADGTWTLTQSIVSDRFFNQTQVDTSTCADIVELAADPKAGDSTSGRCTNGDSYAESTYRVVGLESLTIGGTKVDTVHLEITTTQGGSRSGGGKEDRWVQAGTNLVVRAKGSESDESPSPVGRVTYTQEYEITLQSMTPAA